MSTHKKTTEDKLDSILDSEHFDIVFEKEETQKCVVTLSKFVEFEFVYSKLLSTLRDLPHNCTSVELRLSNFGGETHSCIELFNAFKDCPVPVDVIITAPSYSCGAILALCGDSLTLNKGTFLMFHNYSTSEHGKGGEVTLAVTHWAEYSKNYDHEILSPFLTKKEVERINNDNDLYINWNDTNLKTRIKRHFKLRVGK